MGVKGAGPEFDHSPISSEEIKNAWSYTSTPPIHIYGVVFSLKKHRNTFTFDIICEYDIGTEKIALSSCQYGETLV
jgi:hypothetical protein